MREIKFRVWDEKRKRMYLVNDIDGLLQNTWFCPKGSDDGNWEDDVELMQYTGIKDDNDKEIYEGDILRFWDRDAVIADTDGEIGYVVFNKFNGWVVNKEKYDDEMSYYQILAFCENYEIIGNIYENPELLKGVGAS